MRPQLVIASAVLVSAGAAFAADDAWKILKDRYEELARNHDDEANRERRYVLLDMFPFRTEKACKRVLKEAWDDERWVDNRVAVVHLVAGCGDGRMVTSLISDLREEDRLRSPVIALGEGLGFTPDPDRAEIAERVVKQMRRAKGELRLSLIEGLGALGDPAALPWLLDAEDLTPEEWFERNFALGLCGDDEVLPTLVEGRRNALADVRLGTARGLAALGTDAALAELAEMLADPDERVVRRAAQALVDAGRKEAAPALATALGNVLALRSKEELRSALRTLLGQDMGHDAAAWKALADGKPAKAASEAPAPAELFGLPVASDRFTLIIDTSRSTTWNDRLEAMKDECVAFVRKLPDTTSFALLSASRDVRHFSEGAVLPDQRDEAVTWIEELLPGGGFDMHQALEEALRSDPLLDTIVIATDSHPWGQGRASGSRETMEIFRRMNRTRDVRLIIALVMPGGRYEPSERSEAEIDERIDYLTEMAEDSGGAFVNVQE